MSCLRRILAAAGPAVLAGALATACSGTSAPASPAATNSVPSAPPSSAAPPGTTPAPGGPCHAGVNGADCAIDQDTFVYSVARFLADPRTGLVGALHMPKEPYVTWIHRMRAFELFYSFGFLRVAQSQVDSVPCVPGSFCGFRRAAPGAAVPLGHRRPAGLHPLRAVQPGRRRAGTAVLVPDDPGRGTHMMVPAHVFLWLMSLEWAIIRPDVHHNLGKWLGFLLSAQALALVPKFLVLAYYRRLRLLPWAVLWLPFELLKRLFLLEALLAYRMRPVKPPLPVRGRFPTWGSMLRPWRPRAAENAGA